jgi:hypothetical protein
MKVHVSLRRLDGAMQRENLCTALSSRQLKKIAANIGFFAAALLHV